MVMREIRAMVSRTVEQGWENYRALVRVLSHSAEEAWVGVKIGGRQARGKEKGRERGRDYRESKRKHGVGCSGLVTTRVKVSVCVCCAEQKPGYHHLSDSENIAKMKSKACVWGPVMNALISSWTQRTDSLSAAQSSTKTVFVSSLHSCLRREDSSL